MSRALFFGLLLQLLQLVAPQSNSGSDLGLKRCGGLYIPLLVKSSSYITIFRDDLDTYLLSSDWSTLNATNEVDPVLFPVPQNHEITTGVIRVQELCSVEVRFLRTPPRDPLDITSITLHRTSCCGFLPYNQVTDLTAEFVPGEVKLSYRETRDGTLWCANDTSIKLAWKPFVSSTEVRDAASVQSWSYLSEFTPCDTGITNITVTINYKIYPPVSFRATDIGGCGQVVELHSPSYEGQKLLQYLVNALPNYQCPNEQMNNI